MTSAVNKPEKLGHSSQPHVSYNWSTSVLTEWSRLKDVLLVLAKTIPDTLNSGKETQMAIQ